MLPATSTRGARSSPIGRASWPAQRSASSSSQGSRTEYVAAKPCARKRPWPVSSHEKPALFVSTLTTRNFLRTTLVSASGLTRPTGPDLPKCATFRTRSDAVFGIFHSVVTVPAIMHLPTWQVDV